MKGGRFSVSGLMAAAVVVLALIFGVARWLILENGPFGDLERVGSETAIRS